MEGGENEHDEDEDDDEDEWEKPPSSTDLQALPAETQQPSAQKLIAEESRPTQQLMPQSFPQKQGEKLQTKHIN